MSRNPIEKERIEQISKIFPGIDWNGPYDGYVPTIRKNCAGFNMIGCSGAGKSLTLESVLPLIPQVIEHTKYKDKPFDQKQLVWLKLDCPHDGSLRGLCVNFFEVVDAVMKTTKADEIHSRMTTDVMLPKMAKRADSVGLGGLFVDEIQRLSLAASGGAQKALNFFIMLSTYLGIPVVLLGTYKALELFSEQFAMVRRGEGQGDMIMSNMLNDDYWEYFLAEVWKYQYTNIETVLNPKLIRTIYEQSAGIVDIAVKLYMLSQSQIIGTGNELITPKLIEDVARESLSGARPLLEALRRGDTEVLKKIDDMFLPQNVLHKYLNSAERRIALSGSLDVLKNNSQAAKSTAEEHVDSPDELLAKLLVNAGYEKDTAVRCARAARDRFAMESDVKLASAEAFRLAAEEELSRKEKAIRPAIPKKKEKVISLSDDLREIITNKPKGMAPYEALMAAGLIKPADEFMRAS